MVVRKLPDRIHGLRCHACLRFGGCAPREIHHLCDRRPGPWWLDRIRFLERALQHVPEDTRHINFWSDCGLHFRCYQLAYWALVALPRQLTRERGVVVTIRLQFFCEMHGKGPCDGHFSVLKGWVNSYCLAGGLVSSLSDVKAAFDEGAASAMKLHAPPAGPEYHTEVLDVAALGPKPIAFLEISAYGADPTLLRISKTYCLASACIPPAHQPAADRKRQGLAYVRYSHR